MTTHRRIIWFLGIALVLIATFLSVLLWRVKVMPQVYGATFSSLYAQSLGLDWKEAYGAVLDDLGAKKLRIPIYWSEIEPEKGVYYFEDVDWMMEEAQKRNASVTLVIGQKVPRWPECFIPDWAEYESQQTRSESLLQFLEMTVERYKNHSALERWQVENESFFPFGECPQVDPKALQQEIDLVKSLDRHHPLQQTTSGEQSFWVNRAIPADVLGVSLYRVVQDEFFGVLVFPYRPNFYAIQSLVASPFARVIISELQAEPWGINGFRIGENESVEAAYDLFPKEDLEAHFAFARDTGIKEVYVWGVEWWYYLHVHGEERLWESAKPYFE